MIEGSNEKLREMDALASGNQEFKVIEERMDFVIMDRISNVPNLDH